MRFHHIVLREVNLNGAVLSKSEQLVFVLFRFFAVVHLVDTHSQFIPKFLVRRLRVADTLVILLVAKIVSVVFFRPILPHFRNTSVNLNTVCMEIHRERVFAIAADFTANFVFSQYDVSSVFHNNSFMPQKYKNF